MRITSPVGTFLWSFIEFPDGQSHFRLKHGPDTTAAVTIEEAITTPERLFRVLQIKDTLTHNGYSEVNLDIRWLMGARMDRRMSSKEPFTLEIIARILNGAGFKRIRIMDPHSSVATTLLDAEAWYPTGVVHQVMGMYSAADTVVVCPDKGARERCNLLLNATNSALPLAYAEKTRDPLTGALSGFKLVVEGQVKGRHCLILDDICDGGGTFSGLAEVLHAAGAKHVDLFVTHGLFSRGLPLKGINYVYCTDSLRPPQYDNLSVFPVVMSEGSF